MVGSILEKLQRRYLQIAETALAPKLSRRCSWSSRASLGSGEAFFRFESESLHSTAQALIQATITKVAQDQNS
jgi:hypothetical protein